MLLFLTDTRVFPIYLKAGIARRTRRTERGSVTEASVTEASVRDNGKEEHQVLLPNTPRASLADRASLVNRDFKIQRRGRQQERQKNNKFNKQNNNFASASRFFVHFFARFARLRRENA